MEGEGVEQIRPVLVTPNEEIEYLLSNIKHEAISLDTGVIEEVLLVDDIYIDFKTDIDGEVVDNEKCIGQVLLIDDIKIEIGEVVDNEKYIEEELLSEDINFNITTKIGEAVGNQNFIDVTDYNELVVKLKRVKHCFCLICHTTFVDNRALDDHTKHCHVVDAKKGKTTSLNYINYHLNEEISSDKRPFECTDCQKKFNRMSQLNRHKWIHSDKQPFDYSNCQKDLSFAMELSDVELFNTEEQLELHEDFYSDEKPHKCNVCRKEFSSSIKLISHNKHIHTDKFIEKCTDVKPNERTISQKIFQDTYGSNRNTRVHTDEKRKCNICLKKFAKCFQLKRHQYLIHNIGKCFKCKECDKAFFSVSELNKHVLIHTGEKPYKCNICQKKFSQLSHLNRHKVIHSGEKPFECSICHKLFDQLANLNRHELIHSGEKPWECDICLTKFRDRSYLKSHKKSRSGNNKKSHKCDYCDKTYSNRCDLNVHKRRYHDEPFCVEKNYQ